ncbi:protein shisa-5-like [Ambystoma mexicanum]|uniref:protein shisa-5-like n=1 Tax=Ambystoma mexicanum TaxID=8296 RepID=UPI0037E912A0
MVPEFRVLASLTVLCILPLYGVVAGDDCDAYVDTYGQWHTKQYCSMAFCCGTCNNRYCCFNPFDKLDEDQMMCSMNSAGFGTFIAVGITIFVLFIVTIILCFTCSCCCLYKMCRRSPQPVVTTTTATVIHAPYPQQQMAPQNYPAPAAYPAYHPVPVHPSHMYPGAMPAGGQATASYPTQYPPPYPAQVAGPPGYQETMATGAGVPYPAAQPPYNPAFVDSPKQGY